MRKIIWLAAAFAVFALLTHGADAAGVKLTQQQVATVCGKGLQGNGTVSGCKKKCGLNGEQDCEYSCYKGKECQGYCSTCGAKRTVVFPNLYGKRVVRQSLRVSP